MKSDSIDSQVQAWIAESEKRQFLLEHSPQADLYHRMLVAKAQGTYDNFRASYNRGILPQQPFVFDQTLNLKIRDSSAFDVKGLARRFTQLLSRLGGGIKESISYHSDFLRDASLEIEDSSLSTLDILDYRDQAGFSVDSHENFLGSVGPASKMISDLCHKKDYADANILFTLARELIGKVVQIPFSTRDFGADGSLLNAYYDLEAFVQQDTAHNRAISRDIRKAKSLEYSISLSNKDPLDVTFGNDSGCCLGIYPSSGDLGNAFGLPHMILDEAFYVFNLNVTINKKKTYRVGICGAFEGVDKSGNRILAINTNELSSLMVPPEHRASLVKYIHDAVTHYASLHGFDAVISGSTQNAEEELIHALFSSSKKRPHVPVSLKKATSFSHKAFYSDLFDASGEAKKAKEFYLLWQREGSVLYDAKQYILWPPKK